MRNDYDNFIGFFQSLVGNKYEPLIVPPRLESENFEALLDKVRELRLNCDILENWYFKEGNEYILKDCRLISIRFFNLSRRLSPRQLLNRFTSQ